MKAEDELKLYKEKEKRNKMKILIFSNAIIFAFMIIAHFIIFGAGLFSFGVMFMASVNSKFSPSSMIMLSFVGFGLIAVISILITQIYNYEKTYNEIIKKYR